MKNNYVGDINDFRKYGLLRSISRVVDFRLLLAWMLTPDDGSTDGKFTKYLAEPGKWSSYDPSLFSKLKAILNNEERRNVGSIEKSGLLGKVDFFSDYMPDGAQERARWFSVLLEKSHDCGFVFLDPDNGLEVKSQPYGRKDSSKYLYWDEVESLWLSGKSLLIASLIVPGRGSAGRLTEIKQEQG